MVLLYLAHPHTLHPWTCSCCSLPGIHILHILYGFLQFLLVKCQPILKYLPLHINILCFYLFIIFLEVCLPWECLCYKEQDFIHILFAATSVSPSPSPYLPSPVWEMQTYKTKFQLLTVVFSLLHRAWFPTEFGPLLLGYSQGPLLYLSVYLPPGLPCLPLPWLRVVDARKLSPHFYLWKAYPLSLMHNSVVNHRKMSYIPPDKIASLAPLNFATPYIASITLGLA